MSASLYAQPTQLLSIYYGDTKNKQIQIGFILSASIKYNAFIETNPNRLVVDFTDSVLAENFAFPASGHLLLEKIHSLPIDIDDLRMVFYFKPDLVPVIHNVKKDISGDKHLLLSVSLNQNPPGFKQYDRDKLNKDSISTGKSNLSVESTVNKKSFLSDLELTGKIIIEDLGFIHNKLDSRQHNNYISGAIEPEIYYQWDNGKQSFTFVPFYRYSQHDSRRTHFDIRELTWLLAEDDWELRVGFRKVFWGVAEGLHLVDIINQTDLVENNDTEDKLGQPMINLALIRKWGTIDLFILPGFRDRTFAGVEGRLRAFPEVDVSNAIYQKHGIEKHLGFAARWSHSVGAWDVGVSHFYGMGREPTFKLNNSSNESIKLIPFYQLINQTGIDIQLTYEEWILKHEAIVRSGQGKTFYATTSGVEYTLFNLFSSGLDLGGVVEYMYDTRGTNNVSAPFQDDILAALRFGFNDIQSTEILAGVLFDRTNNTKFYNIEASRRLGESFTIDMEMRLFSGAPATDPAYSFREDDHFRVELGYHF